MDKLNGLRKEFQDWHKKRSLKGEIPLYAIEYWWLKKMKKLIESFPLLSRAEIEMMMKASPNPLKAELVHNKGEKQKAYFNKGYNEAIKDILYNSPTTR